MGTKVYIATFAILAAIYCAIQFMMHLAKYLNIQKHNDNATIASINDGGAGEITLDNPYDSGCWVGGFTDEDIVKRIKSEVCVTSDGQIDVDCIQKGSNWTFIYFFNMIVYAAMTFNFMLHIIGACNGYVRHCSGLLFMLVGSAYIVAIVFTWQHRISDND